MKTSHGFSPGFTFLQGNRATSCLGGLVWALSKLPPQSLAELVLASRSCSSSQWIQFRGGQWWTVACGIKDLWKVWLQQPPPFWEPTTLSQTHTLSCNIYLFQKFISSSDLESHPQSRRAKAYNPSKPLMIRRDIKTKGHIPAGRGRGSCRVEGRYLAWTICSHSGRPLKDFYPNHESRKEVGRPTAGIFSTPKLICQYLCTMYSNFFSVIATTGSWMLAPKRMHLYQKPHSLSELMYKNNAISNGPSRKKPACQ